jgi:hypothetical protein
MVFSIEASGPPEKCSIINLGSVTPSGQTCESVGGVGGVGVGGVGVGGVGVGGVGGVGSVCGQSPEAIGTRALMTSAVT